MCSEETNHLSIKCEEYVFAEEDCTVLKKQFVSLVIDVIRKHMPSVAFPCNTSNEDSSTIKKIPCTVTKVIPLPVLYLDEQKNSDVVHILTWYQKLIEEVYASAEVPLSTVHIGGDQLTRIRFSTAKRLRAAALTASDRFQYLTPITFEFFHCQMKLLDYMYKTLYSEHTAGQTGTMFNTKVKIMRSNVTANSHHTFDDNRDFAVSFTDAYIAEGLMEFLGMDSLESTPSNYPLTTDASVHDKNKWLVSTVNEFVAQYVLQGSMTKFGLSNGNKIKRFIH
jgi:hypothetical protein